MILAPLNAIDPQAAHDRWLHQFEYHLDLIPPVMDAIVTTTLPSIQAGKLEARVTGGGHVDNMTRVLAAFDQSEAATGIAPGGAAADARELWGMVTEYVDAVTAWVNPQPPHPASLTRTPDADPLTARRLAFTTIGWLIDHAAVIEPIHELAPYLDDMFTLIRRLRGRYGVAPFSRRPRERCTTCGERAVTVAWATNPNGSPRPLRVARCSRCGEQWAEPETAATQTLNATHEVLSEACADLAHESCRSMHCQCTCHTATRRAAA